VIKIKGKNIVEFDYVLVLSSMYRTKGFSEETQAFLFKRRKHEKFM